MEMTNEETLIHHRELWDWLSKNPNSFKTDWPGWNNGEFEEVENQQYCFACAMSPDCDRCIIKWPGKDCCDIKPGDEKGLYNVWENSKNKKERAKLAARIRDLPVKEE